MGLSQSLFAGITGLKSHQIKMNVIGNNISNVNTVAYKASRVLFQDQISELLAPGARPTGTGGGIDPMQSGLGTRTGTIQTDFSQGAMELTGQTSDLAIDGRGYFVVQSGDTMRFTRDGSFRLARANKTDSQGNMVVDQFGNPVTTQVLLNSQGWKVKGRKGDPTTGETPNPSLSALEDIEVPLGEKRRAKATSNAFFVGNFRADGAQAYTGTRTQSVKFLADTTAIPDGIPDAAANANTDLRLVYDASNNKLLDNSTSSITVTATKGNQTITDTFSYGTRMDQDGTALKDFALWLEGFLGIANTNHDPTLPNASDDGVNDNDAVNEARVVFGNPAAGRPQVTQATTTNVGYGYYDGSVAIPAGWPPLITANQFFIRDNANSFAGVLAGDEVYLSGANLDSGYYTVAGVELVNGVNCLKFAGRGSNVFADNNYYDSANRAGGLTASLIGDTGITVESNPNAFYINGNLGTENNIANLTFASGGVNLSPFSGGAIATASGESVMASTLFYDSLGSQHRVDLRFTLVDQTNTQSMWRWYANSPDDRTNDTTSALTKDTTDSDRVVGSGTVTFDASGQWVSETDDTIQIDYEAKGVTTRLIVNPDFRNMTQFASKVGSEVNVKEQDGLPMGILEKYSVSTDGSVIGIYTNGLTETLAQISLALFPNDNGLGREGGNLFSIGINSGEPLIVKPNTGSAGKIQSGALEQSNVDLSKEFTDMIITERGYQGNARVITTSDEMLVELVNLKR